MEASKKQDLTDTFTENDPSSHASNRQVGMKSKYEEDDDGTDWEQAPVAGIFPFRGDLSTHRNSVYMCLYKSVLSKMKRIFLHCVFWTLFHLDFYCSIDLKI